MPCVWYRRDFEAPNGWNDEEMYLHIGVIDYRSEIYLNGISVKTHIGGYSPVRL